MKEISVTLNPNTRTTKQDIARVFQSTGGIRSVLLFPNHAVVEFQDSLDVLFALYSLNPEFIFPNIYWTVLKIEDLKLSPKESMKKDQVASTSIEKLVTSPHPPPWIELPEDITAKILHNLGPIGMLWTAQRVCTTWRKICRDPTMWRVVNMWNLADFCEIYDFPIGGITELCYLVEDLSQGHVTEINIDKFSCSDLKWYINDRCGQLKCLRIASCYNICFKSLCKGVPLLEELHLLCIVLHKDDIEVIGQSCPLLKTFAMNRRGSKIGFVKVSEDALAIAEYMPELRHLQLIGNKMTNKTLEAILNGCQKLESLDLRKCYNLDLDGELGKRCAQQVKILRRPHDSIDDYKFDIGLPPEHYYLRVNWNGV